MILKKREGNTFGINLNPLSLAFIYSNNLTFPLLKYSTPSPPINNPQKSQKDSN